MSALKERWSKESKKAEASKKTKPKSKRRVVDDEDEFETGTEVLEAMMTDQFEVKAEDLFKAFRMVTDRIPNRAMYEAGEIEIYQLSGLTGSEDDDTVISNFLGGGTRILDLLMFLTYAKTHNEKMFTHINSDIRSKSEASAAKSQSFKVFTAIYEFYFTRGSMPNRSNKSGPLSKNMRTRTLLGTDIETEAELAMAASCAPLDKFPGVLLMHLGFHGLDDTTIRRIQLSPAGTKFVRYFAIAKLHDKGENAGPRAAVGREFAKSVFALTNEQMLVFHPDHPTGKLMKPLQFSLKMCLYAMHTLGPTELVAALKYIDDKGMTAFTKDTMLFKKEGSTYSCPGLDAPDINLEDVTGHVWKKLLKCKLGVLPASTLTGRRETPRSPKLKPKVPKKEDFVDTEVEAALRLAGLGEEEKDDASDISSDAEEEEDKFNPDE